MKFLQFLLIGTLLTAVVFSACEPLDPVVQNNAVIKSTINHHGLLIKKGTAYLKVNADTGSFPGWGVANYDITQSWDNKNGEVSFKGLGKGTYWVYVIGFDSLLMEPVYGAQHCVVNTPLEFINLDIEVFENSHIDTSQFQ